MGRMVFYISLIFFLCCGPTIQKSDLKQLNGYWEITEVVLKNGQKKKYTISTVIEYIEMNGMNGFRKKVQPLLNGSYQTSDDAVPFVLYEREGIFHFNYGQGTQQWEEVLLSLDENSFSVQNQDNKIYRYKRYNPLNHRS